ncbi:MAG: D-glycero-beta-D-manno-heptose 1-phosphate adenylyltransferase [Flavobacteriales bacterium]|nr:D-glycero-beta-D-manno-heptose 1-phosphate adenylyltransferase [Flavobacteriales bacterium]|tara:strand:+ start:5933 stop:6424 length:492 start_codon:yes stop_codon:yes gene_type:complete
MSHLKKIGHKIFRYKNLINQVESWKKSGDKIVFTNGCFDIFHRGHIELLARTADLGDKLIVGLNSDSSIQKIKGNSRPIIDEDSRALLLATLSFVDAVILFSEETPIKLITDIKPNILAKGGDYEKKSIVGHDIIKKNGGEVILIPYIDGFSSTNIINKIKKS